MLPKQQKCSLIQLHPEIRFTISSIPASMFSFHGDIFLYNSKRVKSGQNKNRYCTFGSPGRMFDVKNYVRERASCSSLWAPFVSLCRRLQPSRVIRLEGSSISQIPKGTKFIRIITMMPETLQRVLLNKITFCDMLEK